MDLVFNVAKGMVNYYAGLPATNDAIIVVPIETTGIESDATLKDYATLDALLAAANNEQTTMGRKTLSSVISSVDNATDRRYADADDVTWVAATGNAVSALVLCYDPDTTTGSDTDLIPLVKLDFVRTTTGGDIVAVFNSGGFFQAV